MFLLSSIIFVSVNRSLTVSTRMSVLLLRLDFEDERCFLCLGSLLADFLLLDLLLCRYFDFDYPSSSIIRFYSCKGGLYFKSVCFDLIS